MDENVLALLKKSQMFSTSSFRHFETKAEIEPMKDFDFFLQGCFTGRAAERELSDTKRILTNFLKRYLSAWTEVVESQSKGDFNWKEYAGKIFGFLESLDWKEIFEEIRSNKKAANLEIEPNGSVMRIKRIGNILVFKILNQPNARREEHSNGTRAVEALCRAECPRNNQGVYEIVDKVFVKFSIPTTTTSGPAKEFDFDLLAEMLAKALPYAAWDWKTADLISRYQQDPSENLVIGQYHGFDIGIRLIHSGNSEAQKNHIWRKGNIKHIKGSVYQFRKGDDVLLELTIKSSLPELAFDEVNQGFDFYGEQFLFAEAAANFITGLCRIQLDRRLEVQVKNRIAT